MGEIRSSSDTTTTMNDEQNAHAPLPDERHGGVREHDQGKILKHLHVTAAGVGEAHALQRHVPLERRQRRLGCIVVEGDGGLAVQQLEHARGGADSLHPLRDESRQDGQPSGDVDLRVWKETRERARSAIDSETKRPTGTGPPRRSINAPYTAETK